MDAILEALDAKNRAQSAFSFEHETFRRVTLAFRERRASDYVYITARKAFDHALAAVEHAEAVLESAIESAPIVAPESPESTQGSLFEE